MSDEKPCPKCGYCPHCGRSNATPYVPWPWPMPWLQTWVGTDTTSGTTTQVQITGGSNG